MPDSNFLESFIGGLKPTIKPLVSAFNPRSLDDAFEQARFQEEHILALKIPLERTYRKFSHPVLASQKPLPTI